MKKLARFLMVALLICAMMSFAAVPAYAGNVANVSDWNGVKSMIASGHDQVSIYLDNDITVTETITITDDSPRIINIAGRNPNLKYKIGNASKRAFFIEADDVELYFDDNVVITNCRPGDVEGGAIYVEGSDCTIEGGTFEKCKAKYGGAIYIYQDTCKIYDVVFRENHATKDGGAIYADDDAKIHGCEFYDNSAGVDGGSIYDANGYGEVVISNCKFSGGSCGDEGIWVDCNGDAVLWNCTRGNDDYYDDPDEYDGSYTGSLFSGGTLWLIIGVAAVAVAAAVVILVVVKKKKTVTINGVADENSDEEDE